MTNLAILRTALDFRRIGTRITSDSLFYELEAGQVPRSQWGPILGRACRLGWLTRVDTTRSRRRSRKGAWIGVYRVEPSTAWMKEAA